MKPLRTFLLVALALGMFGFIVFYERRNSEDAARAGATAGLLPNFNPASVTSVEITGPTNQSVRVEKTNDAWTLVQPVVYPAHAARVNALLTFFAQLTRTSHISAQDLTSQRQRLSAFGLEPPRATVIVQQDAGRIELTIGSRTPVGNQVYVQLVGSDGIYFIDGAILDRLPQAVDDWRDPAFLPLKGLAFNRLKVEVRTGTGLNVLQLQVDPATHVWRLTGPMAARADNRKLNQLLGQLAAWQIRRFVPENPKPDLEAVGLQSPEVALTFAQGSNDLLVAHFGKSPANDESLVYARCLPRSSPVLVSKDLLSRLRAPFSEFRERRLLSVPLSPVDLIEVRGEEPFSVQRLPDGAWWTYSPQPQPADAQFVTNFFASLTALEITDFERDEVTEDYSSWGLNRPRRQFIMRLAVTNSPPGVTNRIIAQVDFGTNQADKVYARIQGENSVYAVKLDAYRRLPVQAFQLMDRRVWLFNTNDVTSVSIRLKGESWKLARNADHQWTLAPRGTPLDFPLPHILDEALYRLGRLQVEAWTAQGDDKLDRFGIPDADDHVDIEVNSGQQVLRLALDFGRMAPNQNLYVAVTKNGRRYVFEMALWFFDPYLTLLRSLPPSPSTSADNR
jgi:hypothetical protein